MGESMIHWNGSQMCAIDTETTGLVAGYHDLIQICILPLDSNIRPRKDVLPFYIEMIPYHPERADPKAMQVNRLDFAIIGKRGHHPDKAVDLFEEWVSKLGLPETKYGRRKKIIPLGQNYPFDMAFIKEWIGPKTYDEYFDYNFRDTKVIANYLNDHAGMHVEKVPFPRTSLANISTKLNVVNPKAHDALADCQTTAEVYRKFLQRGLLG